MCFTKLPGATLRLKICSGQLENFSEQEAGMWLPRLLRRTQDNSVASSPTVAIYLLIIVFFFKLQFLKWMSQFSLKKKNQTKKKTATKRLQISSSFGGKEKLENETSEGLDILETPNQILLGGILFGLNKITKN